MTSATPVTGTGGGSRIDAMLARARARLRRVDARRAAAEVERGAVLVDIRPAAQRAEEGEIPGALVIERNVLEWRLDPTSDARLPVATGDDLRVIIICSEGYTSSLAAASLQELGLRNATDVIGGYHAWRRAGLPTTSTAAAAAPAVPSGQRLPQSRLAQSDDSASGFAHNRPG